MPRNAPCDLVFDFHPAFDPFLKRRKKSRTVVYRLERKTTVCDIIEAIGIPHTEIGGIRHTGKLLDFGFIPTSFLHLVIEPLTPPVDVLKPGPLRPVPLPDLRFTVDENVARLAPFLRMVGLDAAFIPGANDDELARITRDEHRILLSKDIELFKRRMIVFGRYIRALRPLDQLREVLDFFALPRPLCPFSRCLICNAPLVPVKKETILDRLEPKTKRYYHEFKQCADCGNIVWKGSHHDHMIASLKSVGIEF
ncbi:Mut7-C RNAse domain-containing protein [Desulfatiferula olefinivorans]